MTKTVSAIDGTHIEIVNWFLCLLHLFQRQFLVSCNRHCLEFFISSGDNKIDYFSRNQTYSRNSQNVVGGDLEFFDIATGYTGSIHDARILRNAVLYIQAECNFLIKQSDLHPLLIGDRTYPANTFPGILIYPQNRKILTGFYLQQG